MDVIIYPDPACDASRLHKDSGGSIFERYLTVWVALCIIAGVALGHLMPGAFHAIGAAEVAKVNLPVAVLIWLMVVPMLIKIDFAALGDVRQHWRGVGVTPFINWAVLFRCYSDPYYK
jgi:ACR3 family arsenite transporter